MEFVITEIKQFRVVSDTREGAISAERILLNEQTVINARGQNGQRLSKAVPIDKWPVWAKALKQFATAKDKGIGDVIARIIGPEKSDAFKSWFLVTFGRPCNCNGRQERWNKLYPLHE